ncbi:hypothetical protein FBULB1_7490 [Fusarium bulbicola]|nr:hypothetical protein FBULB1_7490 [Fusarium bulbicola]
MSLATTVEQPLLRVAPSVPWPSVGACRNLPAVIVAIDYGYVDTLDSVPSNIRGRIPRQIKDGERLMIWKGEMGYLFGRNPINSDVLVLIFKGALQIPVVLPSSIVVEGRPFRDLTQQTTDLLGPTREPQVSIRSHSNDRALQKFIRSFVLSTSRQQGDLRLLGLSPSEADELFMGNNLDNNVDALLEAILPEAKQKLEDGRFSLQNILDLRHASIDWPGDRPCIYVRIYTDPEDQPEDESRDEAQDDIDEYVGVYVGQSRQVWVRHLDHERNIEFHVPAHGKTHYNTAVKSLPEDRHTIPLLVFEDRSISSILLNMAEQVMLNALRAEARWIFAATPGNAMKYLLQRRARLFSDTARAVRSQVNWPRLNGQGLNVSSPLLEERYQIHLHCIPMATSGGPFGEAFTTYRMGRNVLIRENIAESRQGHYLFIYFGLSDGHRAVEKMSIPLPYDPEGITGLRPDVRSGYLVAEIMNDRQPHPRAFVGCPSVGPFENFHEGPCIALRFEWQADGRWYTVYLQRPYLHLRYDPTRPDPEYAIEAYRAAMKLIQAFEGTVYTEPLNGFPQSLTMGNVQMLQTDHLNQRYRWVSQQRVTRPAPAKASWGYNYKLMVKNFGNDLFDEMSNEQMTFVGPSDPMKVRHGALNWSEEDVRVGAFKCDSCTAIDMLSGRVQACTRDESRNDVWVCKHCSLFNRPCTFTPFRRLKRLIQGTSTVSGTDTSLYPKGLFRFLSFHHTMSPQEIGEIFEVSEPLFEKLGVSENEDGDDEEDT